MDPREANLPKWAQAKLNLLRMRLSEANATVEKLSGPRTDYWSAKTPGIFRDVFGNTDGTGYLLPDHAVVVVSEDGLRTTIYASRHGHLYLNGIEPFVIVPDCSNAIFLKKGRL